MSWFEMKEQRRRNRQDPSFREGHRRRHGFSALLEKKKDAETGRVELVVAAVAKDGCFGRLRELDRDLYEEWALGTRGVSV